MVITRIRFWLWIVAFGLGVCACGGTSSDSGAAPLCIPGTTALCNCLGGGVGVQVCRDDGDGYEKCGCEPGGTEDMNEMPEDMSQEPNQDLGTPDEQVDVIVCVPKDFKLCFEDDVYWYDSCGQRGDVAEDCKPPQTSCQNAVCAPGCVPNVAQRCVGNDIYWHDSCGNQGAFVAACTGNTACVGGQCASACIPHQEKQCHEGNVYWFDSCGQPESVADGCTDEQFCANATCVKPFYDGKYWVTADPDKKITALGSVTFVASFFDLEVDGTNVVATDNSYTPAIVYSGTIDGKTMKLAGEYSQDAGGIIVKHKTTITVVFKEPSVFEGVLLEILDTEELGPLGQIVWDITGKKQ